MITLLDVTSLLMRRDRAVMTGIDRVDHALARWLCDRGEQAAFLISWGGLRGVIGSAAMAGELDRMAQRRAPAGAFDQLTAVLCQPPAQRRGGVLRLGPSGRERRSIAQVRTVLAALVHAPGWQRLARRDPGGLHLVHASHAGLEHGRRYRWAEQGGVRSTVFIHDLIPLTHPQFCGAGAQAAHGPKLTTAARLAAAHPQGRIAVNSEDTRATLTEWLTAAGLPVPRVEVHRLGQGAAIPLCASAMPDGARPYFVCAGTIEGRKNVGLLLDVWRGLAMTRLALAMPALVLAGSRGWNCADVLAELDGASTIAPHVFEVAGLTDAELAALMDGAQAVLAPSIAEGFSLVPAEALARGVAVIASDIPAHRELEGRPILLDPRDGSSWRLAVEGAAGWPRPRFRRPAITRTWDDFAAGLLG